MSENNIPKLPVGSWTVPINQSDVDNIFGSDAFYDYTYPKDIVGKNLIMWLGERALSLNTTTPKIKTDIVDVVKSDPVIVEEEDHGGFKYI